LYAYTKSGRIRKWLKRLAGSKLERLEKKSELIRFNYSEVPEMNPSKEFSIQELNDFEEEKTPALGELRKQKDHIQEWDALVQVESLARDVRMDEKEPTGARGALMSENFPKKVDLRVQDEDPGELHFSDMDEREIPDEEVIEEHIMKTITGVFSY
jgi:hypothetical protein